jgi:hypothetical protein
MLPINFLIQWIFLFQPLDGPDTQYGQLHKPITAHPIQGCWYQWVQSNFAVQGFCSVSHN